MNAIVLAIVVMFVLSLLRVSVVLSIVVAAMVGGLVGGLGLAGTVTAFNDGLGNGAQVALAYAALGAFALALSRSGLPDLLAHKLIGLLGYEATVQRQVFLKYLLLGILWLAAVCSQNVIPVHIAFIPVLVPPLLKVMNFLQLDRRAVACTLTFGLVATYMLLPVGFGAIFLNDLLMANLNKVGAAYGLQVSAAMLPQAMLVPVLGMLLGLLVAVFVSYRAPRQYVPSPDNQAVNDVAQQLTAVAHEPIYIKKRTLFMASLAVVATLVVQLFAGSMILGGLIGFAVLSAAGIFRWQEADDVFVAGMRMMALVGFIMIAAAGFAAVMTATGAMDALVSSVVDVIGDHKALAALFMLLVGLLVTVGIGSSFSSIPILALIYVPLCAQFGFSPMATIALIGTAAALGDAGSPASDSTLGPTAGLGIDGQHDHMWDTVVPTFVHFNLPLLVFGWVAAMCL